MNAANAEPITFPHTFHADSTYRWGLAAFTLVGFLGAAYVTIHERHVGLILWLMTGLYLLLLTLVLSLRVQVDDEGLLQRWLFSGARVTWKQVRRLDKTKRSWVLYGDDNKELILLSMLSRPAQTAIAEQAIQRARLRKVAAPPKAPILEQWERKK